VLLQVTHCDFRCAALAFQSREKELLQKEAASESESPEPAEQPPAVAVATVVEESSDSDSHSDFKRVLKKGKMARISPVPRPLSPPPNPPKKKAAKVSRIYIASRTHSQISQLVRELKKTAYKPRMVVLGSRDHYCVNPKVENLGSGAKNAACKRLLQETTGCRFNQGKSRV
jgi:Fanconi anemia group J protein